MERKSRIWTMQLLSERKFPEHQGKGLRLSWRARGCRGGAGDAGEWSQPSSGAGQYHGRARAPPESWQLLNSVHGWGLLPQSFENCGYSDEMPQLSKPCEDRCGLLGAHLPCLLESRKEGPRRGPSRVGLWLGEPPTTVAKDDVEGVDFRCFQGVDFRCFRVGACGVCPEQERGRRGDRCK